MKQQDSETQTGVDRRGADTVLADPLSANSNPTLLKNNDVSQHHSSSPCHSPYDAASLEQGYIVAGWFTPDYKHWAERFRQSLIEHGAPHELVEIEKPKGAGWERVTRLKAGIVLGFMDRHPAKTIILSDVDALVTGDLAPLADLNCDVALRLQCKRLRGRYMLVPRAGTIVINRTPGALRLIEAWKEFADAARYGDTDESSLAQAIASVEGLRIVNLQHNGELGSLIQHDQGSRGKWKASHLLRLLAALRI